MLKRLSLIFLFTTFLLISTPYGQNSAKAVIGVPGGGGPMECSFTLSSDNNGDGQSVDDIMAGAPYVLIGNSLHIEVSKGLPNAESYVTVSYFGHFPDTPQSPLEYETAGGQKLSFWLQTDGSGNFHTDLQIPASANYGPYELHWDKKKLFGDCDIIKSNYSWSNKTFYVPTDGPIAGTYFMTLPFPVTADDTRISMYIIGTDKLKDSTGKSYMCFMVKSYGQDNGDNDPGWTGNFVTQSGGSVCNYDDGGGDICDLNPHPASENEEVNPGPAGENCVEASDWDKNMFLRPYQYVLELKDLCENMEGMRSNCSEHFTREPIDDYRFALYGVTEPPIKDKETKDHEDADKWPDPCVGSVDTKKPPDVDTCDVIGPLGAGPPPLVQEAVYHFDVQPGTGAAGAFPYADKVSTPFGDIPITPAGIATAFLNLGLGVAGGLAFLLMVLGSYRIIFAAGNPDSLQHGREIITAALVGLIVIIFSIFILRLIGVGVLGLPIGT